MVPDIFSEDNTIVIKERKFLEGGPESDFAYILSDG